MKDSLKVTMDRCRGRVFSKTRRINIIIISLLQCISILHTMLIGNNIYATKEIESH